MVVQVFCASSRTNETKRTFGSSCGSSTGRVWDDGATPVSVLNKVRKLRLKTKLRISRMMNPPMPMWPPPRRNPPPPPRASSRSELRPPSDHRMMGLDATTRDDNRVYESEFIDFHTQG